MGATASSGGGEGGDEQQPEGGEQGQGGEGEQGMMEPGKAFFALDLAVWVPPPAL